ncbi:MAG: glutamine--tRNA ligase/YqeY domain fusion protein [Spirochaetales bacterium]|nr:glutamine--tRNA ligase/YqeY domain fusion protein [Spirochaetales bacterium]
MTESGSTEGAKDFIRAQIAEDMASGRFGGKVITRLPPEPNGYPHIGHAKAFLLDYNVAVENNGHCNLRFDDTNPLKEEAEFVEAIKEDLHWIGIDWAEREYYASDYYQALYDMAVVLIKNGKAYVDDLSAEQVREYRGTLTEPGINSPFRERSVEENLDLFCRMKNGEYADGEKTLRAKIDMSAPNINLRDPVMYRIIHATHHRTGDAWCIYPTYDWAHGQSDSIEGITHSLCDLAYEDHRPLYDWFLNELGIHHPRQMEFARLVLGFTVLSKRKLRKLVEEGIVEGWDDPRLPTLRGLRRRGYTPSMIRAFIDRIGISKTHSMVDMPLLEYFAREELNKTARRVMAVLDPVKLVIDNYPENKSEELEAENNPEEPAVGSRKVLFSRELFIEREDFAEEPPPKYYRLAPGKEVRLKHAYYVTCTSFVKDPVSGKVSEIHCTYDPATRGGWSEDGRKVRGTIHWVSTDHAVDIQVRLYDRLFTRENMEETEDYITYLSPQSLTTLAGCKIEDGVLTAPGVGVQFLRQGYFCRDSAESENGTPVYNRIVALKDSWAKIEKKAEKAT